MKDRKGKTERVSEIDEARKGRERIERERKKERQG